MSKTIRNIFYEKLTFESFLEAHKRASKNKTYRKEVILFEMNLENNIVNLINSIRCGNYKVGKYTSFKIYEPKERIIRKLEYRDRVVHQWYVYEFIKPYFIVRFIYDNYACIDNKGTHIAIGKLQSYMRVMKRNYGEYYILKCDVKKFFYNINKDILFRIMSKYINDKYLLELTKKFIYENNDDEGIPIGNYTSQYFANIYLNELDYYVKHNLKCRYYLRYMDDFVLLLRDKDEFDTPHR